MKTEKLPSGSYRIRKTYNKKTYSLTFDHKPTQKEITEALLERMGEPDQTDTPRMTFREAAEKYNAAKEKVISPTTYDNYESILKNLSDEFKEKDIYKMTSEDVQKEISQYSASRSAKTTANAIGYISPVLRFFIPDIKLNITAPKQKKEIPYIPSDDVLKRLIDYSKTYQGGIYYIPIQLCCYGLRRSELIALTLDDLDGNIITINKSKVRSKKAGNKYIIKEIPKTSESCRKVVISDELAEAIGKQGYIYNGSPGQISKAMQHMEKAIGLDDFTAHKLRHYFASAMSGVVPDADIIAMGGWKTDAVMKTVYRHSMMTKNLEAQKQVVKKLNSVLKS